MNFLLFLFWRTFWSHTGQIMAVVRELTVDRSAFYFPRVPSKRREFWQTRSNAFKGFVFWAQWPRHLKQVGSKTKKALDHPEPETDLSKTYICNFDFCKHYLPAKAASLLQPRLKKMAFMSEMANISKNICLIGPRLSSEGNAISQGLCIVTRHFSFHPIGVSQCKSCSKKWPRNRIFTSVGSPLIYDAARTRGVHFIELCNRYNFYVLPGANPKYDRELQSHRCKNLQRHEYSSAFWKQI
jgi:hypothetical protein